MTNPLVSVIVPVFNAAPYLRAALKSIFDQDYRPIEVIVVDDGSSDDSVTIAQGFQDVHVIQIARQGPGGARNEGIARSTGELIAFMDADDLMPPQRLIVQVDHLRQNPDVACVFGSQEFFLEPGVQPPPWLETFERRGEFGGVQVIATLIRRTALSSVGLFDTTHHHGEDLDWLFRLEESGIELAVLPDVVVYRRLHGANMSYDQAANEDAMLRVFGARIRRARAAAGSDDQS